MTGFLKILLLSLAALSVQVETWAEGYRVLSLVGQKPHQVQDLLGEADTCSEASMGLTCEYHGRSIQVIYIHGRADWISFAELPEINFDYYALEYIGLAAVPPFMHNPVRMHWQHHHGLALVSVFGNGKKVALIEVRAYTPQ